MGGCLASPGQAGAVGVGNNFLLIKAATYSVSSASANISAGCVSWPASTGPEGLIQGYQTTRGDFGTKPLIQASGSISTFILIKVSTKVRVENLSVDGANYTSSRGLHLRLTLPTWPISARLPIAPTAELLRISRAM